MVAILTQEQKQQVAVTDAISDLCNQAEDIQTSLEQVSTVLETMEICGSKSNNADIALNQMLDTSNDLLNLAIENITEIKNEGQEKIESIINNSFSLDETKVPDFYNPTWCIGAIGTNLKSMLDDSNSEYNNELLAASLSILDKLRQLMFHSKDYNRYEGTPLIHRTTGNIGNCGHCKINRGDHIVFEPCSEFKSYGIYLINHDKAHDEDRNGYHSAMLFGFSPEAKKRVVHECGEEELINDDSPYYKGIVGKYAGHFRGCNDDYINNNMDVIIDELSGVVHA